MREVPYETDQDVRARSRRDEMYERVEVIQVLLYS